MKGEVHMKILKINDNKGFFSINGNDWIPIDEVNKENLLSLVDIALTDEFEMDEFDKERLGNPAHQVIYNNIYKKLSELNTRRTRFKDEIEALHKEAIEKYSQK